MYGPPFTDPNPLPVRVHGIETPESDDGTEGFWRNDLETSQLCGACHNVKLDIDGDGLNESTTSRRRGSSSSSTTPRTTRRRRRRRRLHPRRERARRRPHPDRGRRRRRRPGRRRRRAHRRPRAPDDLRRVAGLRRLLRGRGRLRRTATPRPSSPTSCRAARLQRLPHAASAPRAIEGPVVDDAPGFLPDARPVPPPAHLRRRRLRPRPRAVPQAGLADEDIARVVAERDALVQSAATLEVGARRRSSTRPTGPVARRRVDRPQQPAGPLLPDGVRLRPAVLARGVGRDRRRRSRVPRARLRRRRTARRSAGRRAAPASPTSRAPSRSRATPSCASATPGPSPGARLDPDDCRTTRRSPPTPGSAAEPRHRLRRRRASRPTECDPWLANFQKILTDGDPDGDGVRQEVPYQPLLPDAVKIRGAAGDGSEMQELQPVRLRGRRRPTARSCVPYVFDLDDGVDPGRESW